MTDLGDTSASGDDGDDDFDELVAAVADGASVDWTAAEARLASSGRGDRLHHLRWLAQLASALNASGETTSVTETWRAGTPDITPALPTEPDLGRFVVEACLGRGGFGVVYKAYDPVRQMHVALKAGTRADVESVAALKREFRILSDLTHPNLVALYELFAKDRSWRISMEFVPGVDFLTYVRRADPADASPAAASAPGQAPRCDLMRLGTAMTQLCDAVAYLHSEGKLHCDVKPSNVLVTADGELKLLDFGIATDMSPAWTDTSVGIHGTPAYVAPEQAAGARPTAASDWYSVGVMLFEALTGTRPFTGTVSGVLAAKQHEAPPRLVTTIAAPEALNELCARLLEPAPAMRPTDAEVLAVVRAVWPTIGRSRLVPPPREHGPFVGRQQQLAGLEQAFAHVAPGRLQVAFLHGVSGIGKSFLIRRFLETLERRQPPPIVLEGRCSERESVPYKALDRLVDRLAHYLLTLRYDEMVAVLPRDVAALGRLFPILRRVDSIDFARRTARLADAQELRRRGGAAFRELLARIAQRHPLVLIIDDLQWTDADSATLLNEVLFDGAAPPVLFVGCYRTDEAASNAQLQALLAAADAARTHGRCEVRTMPIGELAPAEAHELVAALALREDGDEGLAIDAIVEESGRSPLFIHQLMQYSATVLPGAAATLEQAGDASGGALTLDAVIRARTASFGERAQRLLRVLAVYGGPLDPGMAGDVAGLGPAVLNESVTLRTARLVRARTAGAEQQLEVYHDRIREAIMSDIPSAELTDLHERMATALERSPDADPEALVHHFHGAGRYETAAAYARIAGDRAADTLAFDRAARSYRFALDFGRFDDGGRGVRTKLGDALAASGRGYEAARAYLDASLTAEGAAVIDLKRRASEQLLQSGHLDEGMRVVGDVLRQTGLRLPATPRRALLSLLLLRARIALRGLRFHEQHERDVPGTILAAIDTCWSVTTGLAIVDHIRSAEFGARHLLLALSAGEPLRIVRALAMELAYTSISGAKSQPRNDRLVALAEPLAARHTNPEARALIILGQGSAAYMQGRWTTSLQLCEEATRILRGQCTGVAWHIDTSQFYTVLSLLYLGEIAELTRRLPVLLKEAAERNALYAETIVRTRLAYLTRLADDDVEAATTAIRQGMERWSQQGFHNQHYYEMVATAETRLYAGDSLAAWTGLEQRWTAFTRTLLPRVQPVAIESAHLRARAALAAALDSETSGPDRATLLRRADADAARIRGTRAPWADGLGHLILAGTCTLRSAWAVAADHLAAADAIFEQEHMGLHRSAARLRRGQLQGGEDGHALVDAARAAMRAQAIRNPDAFARMLVPGDFDRSRGRSRA